MCEDCDNPAECTKGEPPGLAAIAMELWYRRTEQLEQQPAQNRDKENAKFSDEMQVVVMRLIESRRCSRQLILREDG